MFRILTKFDWTSFFIDIKRKELATKAEFLRNRLKTLGFNIGASSTHIIPIILGDEKTTINAQEALKQENIIVSSIFTFYQFWV